MLVLALLLACAPPPEEGRYPLDDVLRLNHVQALGTHNSYHVAGDPPGLEDWDYTHAPLVTQARDQGVRQFELDFHQDDANGTFPVYHIAVMDEGSTCATLAECLAPIAAWSHAHPAVLPLTFLLEPKDDGGGDPITRYDLLEEAILAAWPDAITPAEVRGSHATLREAITAEGGWPLLGDVRGRALFLLLDSREHREAYRARGEGVLFLNAEDETSPDAAFFLRDDPFDERIGPLLDAGFLVRTATEDGVEAVRDGQTERRDQALESGAHFLSTDFPVPDDTTGYAVTLEGGTPARCNARTAPGECTPEAVEDPALVD
ncbi:MAG: Ca2+-dependent phosphoinositide-specific phospholipase C [Pseudomonadota bacterium]